MPREPFFGTADYRLNLALAEHDRLKAHILSLQMILRRVLDCECGTCFACIRDLEDVLKEPRP